MSNPNEGDPEVPGSPTQPNPNAGDPEVPGAEDDTVAFGEPEESVAAGDPEVPGNPE